MDRGPWFILQKPLFLRCSQSGPVEKLSLQKIPIWVKLWNVPLEMFSPEKVGCIANALGKPVHLDKATAKHRRVSFARICVEANSENNLPKSIEVDIEGMGIISVRIEYP